jgi:hypothetical protein
MSFDFIGGVEKKKNFGCEKYFCKGHILTLLEMLFAWIEHFEKN